MMQTTPALLRRSRLAALLEHFSAVDGPRAVRRILHPLPEILLLLVCGTNACLVASRALTAPDIPTNVREHWAIENSVPRVLDPGS